MKKALSMLLVIAMLISLSGSILPVYAEDGYGTRVGIQTDSSKITASGALNADKALYVFDGDSALQGSQTTTMGLKRADYPAPAVVTVSYDTPITVDTLVPLVTINESQYLSGVTAGSSGTNSDGTRGIKTETLIKDLDVDFKIDYIVDGESEFTEGEWTTVTLTEGSTCTWTYTSGYGRAYAYLPAIVFDTVTVSAIRISIKNFAESTTVAKLWQVKELELYQSPGETPVVNEPEVVFSNVAADAEQVALSTVNAEGTIYYTLDGTVPSPSNGKVYRGAINLPLDQVSKLSAVIYDGDQPVSAVCSHTYKRGTVTSLGIQTDASKIARKNISSWYSLYPTYAFDGDSSFSGGSDSVMYVESNVWAEVTYDDEITFDTVIVPVRVSKDARDGNNTAGASTQEIKLKLQIDAYDTEGTSIESTQTKECVLPVGSNIVYKNSALWAYMPAFELNEITASKIRITILPETANVSRIKEFELYQFAGPAPEVVYSNVAADAEQVALSTVNAQGTIYYTLDGTEPSPTNGKVYSEAITIPFGQVTKLSSVIYDGSQKVSAVCSHTYKRGSVTSVGVQTDASKIARKNISSWYSLYPTYAFDGDSSFSGAGDSVMYVESNVWAEVTYDDEITFDTVIVPIRVSKDARDGNNTAGASTQEICLSLQIDAYDTEGTSIESTQTKECVLPVGSDIVFKNNALWAYMPAIELDEITASKIRITILPETTNVSRIKEFELYRSAGISYDLNFSKPSGRYSAGERITVTTNSEGVVRYTTDGTEPTASSAAGTSAFVLPHDSCLNINAAVFSAGGVKLSDTVSNVYITGAYENQGVQTDQSKIEYSNYSETNNRYPYYAFDGEASLGDASKVWSAREMPVSVTYDRTIDADSLLIGARIKDTFVDTENDVTTDDVLLSLEIRNGSESLTGGVLNLVIPAGSAVKEYTQTGSTNAMVSYWAYFGAGNLAITAQENDQLTFEVLYYNGISAIKEFELIKTFFPKAEVSVENEAVSIVAHNIGEQAEIYKVVHAGYDVYGRLADCQIISWSVPAYARDYSFDTSLFRAMSDIYEHKYFVWSSDMITPLSNTASVIEVEGNAQRMYLTSTARYNYPSATPRSEKYSGQYTSTVYAKLKNDSSFASKPTRTLSAVSGFSSSTSVLDEWGGDSNDHIQDGTGYFEVAKDNNGRWTLVDPDGNRFFSTGVTGVRPADSSEAYKDIIDNYGGSLEDWSAEKKDILSDYGFNTAGAWSFVFRKFNKTTGAIQGTQSFKCIDTPTCCLIPRGVAIKYAESYDGVDSSTGVAKFKCGVPPVFNPDFEEECGKIIARYTEPLKDNPYVIGWWSDNEIDDSQDMLDKALALDGSDPMYRHTSAATWEWFRRTTGNASASASDITNLLREKYREYVFDRYYQVMSRQFKKYAPNHLYLGDRHWETSVRSRGVLNAAAKYCDVVSYNLYKYWTPTVAAEWIAWKDKPVMVTEFYSQYDEAVEGGWLVNSESGVGKFYENFTLRLLEEKNVVGFHYHSFKAFDNSDSSSLKTSAQRINGNIYNLIEYFDTH